MMSVFEDSDWNLKAPPHPPKKKIKKNSTYRIMFKKDYPIFNKNEIYSVRQISSLTKTQVVYV